MTLSLAPRKSIFSSALYCTAFHLYSYTVQVKNAVGPRRLWVSRYAVDPLPSSHTIVVSLAAAVTVLLPVVVAKNDTEDVQGGVCIYNGFAVSGMKNSAKRPFRL